MAQIHSDRNYPEIEVVRAKRIGKRKIKGMIKRTESVAILESCCRFNVRDIIKVNNTNYEIIDRIGKSPITDAYEYVISEYMTKW